MSIIVVFLPCFYNLFNAVIIIPATIFAAGIMATIGCICLGIFSIMSIMQMAMISSRDTVVCSYMANVIIKTVLAVIAGEFVEIFESLPSL